MRDRYRAVADRRSLCLREGPTACQSSRARLGQPADKTQILARFLHKQTSKCITKQNTRNKLINKVTRSSRYQTFASYECDGMILIENSSLASL